MDSATSCSIVIRLCLQPMTQHWKPVRTVCSKIRFVSSIHKREMVSSATSSNQLSDHVTKTKLHYIMGPIAITTLLFSYQAHGLRFFEFENPYPSKDDRAKLESSSRLRINIFICYILPCLRSTKWGEVRSEVESSHAGLSKDRIPLRAGLPERPTRRNLGHACFGQCPTYQERPWTRAPILRF
jgi:hypothetical protein